MPGELHQISVAIGQLMEGQKDADTHRDRLEKKIDDVLDEIRRDRHDARNMVQGVSGRVDLLERDKRQRDETAKDEAGRRARRTTLILGGATVAGGVVGPTAKDLFQALLKKVGL